MRRTKAIVPFLLLLLFELGCGDQYRPIANPIVGPGGQPQNVHFAYVVNYNASGQGSTTKIDVSGDTNLQVQAAGLGSIAEAFQANVQGAMFIANRDSDSVSEFSLISAGPVTSIALFPGSRPVSLASTTTSMMFVVNSGANTVCPSSGSLSAISTSSLVAVSTTCLGINPGAIVQQPNGGKVYVANQGDDTISVYNPVTQNVTSTITQTGGLHQNPVALIASTDGNYIYVVTQGNGSTPGALDIIATATDTVGGSVPLGVSPTFGFLDTHLNRLYVANTGSNSVTVFDVTNISLGVNPAIPTLATVNVGSSPVGITALPNGLTFYVANSLSNNVSVVNATNFAVVDTVQVGLNPVYIASEPTSTKVYAANAASGTISIIQTSNNTVTITMPAPQQDPTCDPKTNSCPLQRPQMIVTQ